MKILKSRAVAGGALIADTVGASAANLIQNSQFDTAASQSQVLEGRLRA